MNDDYGGSESREVSADAEDQRKLEEWAEKLSLSVDDLKVFCRHGFYYEKVPATNSPSRRALLAYLKRADTGPSKWLLISGLYPECQYSEPERRKRLRALYRAVVLLIKRALVRHTSEEADDRSIFWDPIAEICRDLELPASKLSAFCKEYSGNSLSQVVDCVRAERIKKLLKVKIRSFVRDFRTHCAALVQESAEKIDCWGVWTALKKSRRWPEFCRNTWAIELGFSSYRRLYRACLAVWKQTPQQLELALIAECLNADELKNSSDDVENPPAAVAARYTDGGLFYSIGVKSCTSRFARVVNRTHWTKPDYYMKTTLYVNYYTVSHPQRREELETAMQLNIKNPQIDTIFVLGQCEQPPIFVNDKIVWRMFNASNRPRNRPDFADYFAGINSTITSSDDISIVSNADIYFDNSLAQLKSLNLEGICLALSRWDLDANDQFMQIFGNNSQDTWIFQGRIRPQGNVDFSMGTSACDNRLAWELWTSGYRVINPCEDIRCYHLHSSNIRCHGTQVKGPHATVHRRSLKDCRLGRRQKSELGVISFSLWTAQRKYCQGAIENAKLARQLYAGWFVRIYHDDTVPSDVLKQLTALNVELFRMPNSNGFSGSFWRFLIADDTGFSRWIVRDCDSRLNYRERRAVDEWLASGHSFHVMRDHPNHNVINSGAFGGVRGSVEMIKTKIDQWQDKTRPGCDETFLAFVMLPLMKGRVLIHDSITQFRDSDSYPFPTKREFGRFCVERCDEDEHFNIHDRFNLLEAERFLAHE